MPRDQELAPQLPRVPWSEIRHEFIQAWGYPDGQFEPQHVEILGPTGSGKTYAEATLLRERVRRRKSAVIFIATKPVDKTILLLGWPIVDDWREVTKHRQVIFWPRSDLQGEAWEAYVERKIYDLLVRLWKAKAKVVLVFDEIGTVEELSRRMRIIIGRYWREARSVGITIVAMKQRPQGVRRDMHSETVWILVFRPKDEDDAIRVAQVMGSRRQWLDVIMNDLDAEAHEFVLLNTRTREAVITWIDIPLKPAAPARSGLYQKVA
jgi:nucleoside-triphosphatase THEP1